MFKIIIGKNPESWILYSAKLIYKNESKIKPFAEETEKINWQIKESKFKERKLNLEGRNRM